MPRSELIGAGYWTSSSGVTIYRGGAYPPEFRGNVFIGEVAGNLVHRQLLTRDGVTFKSRRADENTEFIRSRTTGSAINFVTPGRTCASIWRETTNILVDPLDIKQLDSKRPGPLRLTPPNFAPRQPAAFGHNKRRAVAHLESPHSGCAAALSRRAAGQTAVNAQADADTAQRAKFARYALRLNLLTTTRFGDVRWDRS
jgi:hypothetical protein